MNTTLLETCWGLVGAVRLTLPCNSIVTGLSSVNTTNNSGIYKLIYYLYKKYGITAQCTMKLRYLPTKESFWEIFYFYKGYKKW